MKCVEKNFWRLLYIVCMEINVGKTWQNLDNVGSMNACNCIMAHVVA